MPPFRCNYPLLRSTALPQAPAKPKTAYGQMLQYYLKMQPQLFTAAVEQQLQRLKEEKDAKEASATSAGQQIPTEQLPPAVNPASHPELGDVTGSPVDVTGSPGDMVLYQRMEEVRAREVRATLEDLMYGE